MKILFPVVLLCVAVTGCMIPKPPKFQAGGVTTVVQFQDRPRVAGQFIAARPDHMIVLDSTNTIVWIYYSAIKSARFQGAGTLISGQKPPADSVRVMLNSVSAFPQGISDSLLAVLRSAYSAGGPRVIRQ